MKTFKLSIFLLLLVVAVSCKKTDNSALAAVTADDAADMAASSLAENSYGLATVTDNVSANALAVASVATGSQSVNSVGAHKECGSTWVDSLSNSGASGSVSFSYFFKFGHTLNCNANSQPDNISNVLIFHGNFDGPRLTSSNTGDATFTIAGLTQNATSYVINGQYNRKGSFQSKVGNKKSGQDSVNLVVTNLTLTKPGRKISGGTGTITIAGTTSAHGSFSFTGTLVFNGDGTANLTVEGTVYLIDLITGEKNKH
ncbi:MAG TPA: hypothetical protein VK668_12915 [Mucilaginibacter sp.]|nr:hypothetical protein [Mucilaginibacter sp.]